MGVQRNNGVEREPVRESVIQLPESQFPHVDDLPVSAWHHLHPRVPPLGGARADARAPVAADTLTPLEDSAQESADSLGRGHEGGARVGVVAAAHPHACHANGARHHALRTLLHLWHDAAAAGGLAHQLLELRVPDAHRAELRERCVQRWTISEESSAVGRLTCGKHREVAEAHGVAVSRLLVVALLLGLDDAHCDAEKRRLAETFPEVQDLIAVEDSVRVAISI
mmetsp:Transcript_33754/g.105266  ORF Transcript_33754/g.105266 Transcript_33754/m.105266 type:complete len:225 (-) Transcript_33754:443-1117(-)